MSNRTQMRARVREELGDTTVPYIWTDTLLDALLVEAVEWYSRLYPMQSTAYRDVVVGQRRFDLPEGTVGLRAVECPLGTLLPEEAEGTAGAPEKGWYRQAWSVWKARYVVDATGLGLGLAQYLERALRGKVTPFVFSLKSKSDLGWAFLGCIESGRYKEYRVEEGLGTRDWGSGVEGGDDEETRKFWAQVGACGYTVDPGPGKIMRWGVPEGSGHDDFVMSAALVGALDELDWRPRVKRDGRRGEGTVCGWTRHFL